MKKINIIVHQRYLDEIIKALHEEGIMQISEISKEEAENTWKLTPSLAHPETTLCLQYEQRICELIRILKKNKKKTTGIKSILSPLISKVDLIEDINNEELYSDVESTLAIFEKTVLKKHHRLEQINERMSNLNIYIENIKKLISFDFFLDDIGVLPSVIIKVGITEQLPELEKSCETISQSVLNSKQIRKGKKPQWAVILIAYISEQKEIEKIYNQYMVDIELPLIHETPKDAINIFKKEKKQLEIEKKEIKYELRTKADHHLLYLQSLREQVQIERMRKEIIQRFAQTETTIFIKGWIRKDQIKQVSALIEKTTNDHAVVNFSTPSLNPDHPPTHIRTPEWAQGFKTLVELFAIPRYNEINPTIIMGIFFVIFFGFMLGDAGYGIIILILSLVGYIKLGKFSPMIKDWSFMGIWLGTVTTIVGFLTYSIFGNLIHMMLLGNSSTQVLYQFAIMGIKFPIDSLKDPITILTIALLFGIIHLNIGIILGLYQALKRKQYKEMLTEKLCWIPLQIGGGMLIGYFILDWYLPDILITIAGFLVLIGIIQLLYASGPIGFFDITGYIGDWLSYARLLALGLATSGMALAFNIVSQLLGEMIPLIGIFITILLLIVLHMVNLIIQALGAGVHSLRLQYVEFFNRFYEGGGIPFTPFQTKRIYTQIKKDKNS